MLPFLGACTNAPGICAQSVRFDSVRTGWCYEVGGPGECPTFWSVNEEGETEWEYVEGGSCPTLGYIYHCGEGIWEDVPSECPDGAPIETVTGGSLTGTTGGATGTSGATTGTTTTGTTTPSS